MYNIEKVFSKIYQNLASPNQTKKNLGLKYLCIVMMINLEQFQSIFCRLAALLSVFGSMNILSVVEFILVQWWTAELGRRSMWV